MENIISKLIDIKEDVDAIYHHQTDRIVAELTEVIKRLSEIAVSNSKSPIK